MSNPWLVRTLPRPAAPLRLFCFPYAGVGASAYRLWPAALPAEVEVCVVQLPGREARLREPAIPDIPAIVDALLPVLAAQLDRPFVFFGHSMGSAIAWAAAQKLAAAGSPLPAHVILSGRRAPHLPDSEPPLRHLGDDAFIAEIQTRFGGIPAPVLADRELMALLLPGLRADITALETFQPPAHPPLPVPLSVLGGEQDARASREQLEAWRAHTAREFRVRVFPGGHFYLNTVREAVLEEVSGILRPLLRPACEPPAPARAVT